MLTDTTLPKQTPRQKLLADIGSLSTVPGGLEKLLDLLLCLTPEFDDIPIHNREMVLAHASPEHLKMVDSLVKHEGEPFNDYLLGLLYFGAAYTLPNSLEKEKKYLQKALDVWHLSAKNDVLLSQAQLFMLYKYGFKVPFDLKQERDFQALFDKHSRTFFFEKSPYYFGNIRTIAALFPKDHFLYSFGYLTSGLLLIEHNRIFRKKPDNTFTDDFLKINQPIDKDIKDLTEFLLFLKNHSPDLTAGDEHHNTQEIKIIENMSKLNHPMAQYLAASLLLANNTDIPNFLNDTFRLLQNAKTQGFVRADIRYNLLNALTITYPNDYEKRLQKFPFTSILSNLTQLLHNVYLNSDAFIKAVFRNDSCNEPESKHIDVLYWSCRTFLEDPDIDFFNDFMYSFFENFFSPDQYDPALFKSEELTTSSFWPTLLEETQHLINETCEEKNRVQEKLPVPEAAMINALKIALQKGSSSAGHILGTYYFIKNGLKSLLDDSLLNDSDLTNITQEQLEIIKSAVAYYIRSENFETISIVGKNLLAYSNQEEQQKEINTLGSELLTIGQDNKCPEAFFYKANYLLKQTENDISVNTLPESIKLLVRFIRLAEKKEFKNTENIGIISRPRFSIFMAIAIGTILEKYQPTEETPDKKNSLPIEDVTDLVDSINKFLILYAKIRYFHPDDRAAYYYEKTLPQCVRFLNTYLNTLIKNNRVPTHLVLGLDGQSISKKIFSLKNNWRFIFFATWDFCSDYLEFLNKSTVVHIGVLEPLCLPKHNNLLQEISTTLTSDDFSLPFLLSIDTVHSDISFVSTKDKVEKVLARLQNLQPELYYHQNSGYTYFLTNPLGPQVQTIRVNARTKTQKMVEFLQKNRSDWRLAFAQVCIIFSQATPPKNIIEIIFDLCRPRLDLYCLNDKATAEFLENGIKQWLVQIYTALEARATRKAREAQKAEEPKAAEPPAPPLLLSPESKKTATEPGEAKETKQAPSTKRQERNFIKP